MVRVEVINEDDSHRVTFVGGESYVIPGWYDDNSAAIIKSMILREYGEGEIHYFPNDDKEIVDFVR